jgi:hypothetical protein
VKGICSSCKRQKYEVHAKKSALFPNMDLLMCNTCIKKGYEPRHLIIIAARSGNLRAATPFIVSALYDGDKIHAEDILKDG